MEHDIHGDFNPGVPWQKQQSTRKIIKFRKRLSMCYTWSTALYGSETWTLLILDQKYPGNFDMWCKRGMVQISLIDQVRNEEVLHTVNEDRNIVHTIKGRKANWIGHILHRNCPRKYVIEEKIEGMIEVT
jgi:hypothetical protein